MVVALGQVNGSIDRIGIRQGRIHIDTAGQAGKFSNKNIKEIATLGITLLFLECLMTDRY